MFEEIFRMAALGVIQGVTEFLPISSSGHLALAARLLGLREGTVLATVVLHAGTMAAVLFVFWAELTSLLRPERHRLLLQVLAATVMVGVAGLSLRYYDLDELLFERYLFIPGCGFLISAAMLAWGLRRQPQAYAVDRIPWPAALRIGLIQVVSILPGVSRSGSTITTGLRQGLKREAAATFSFLLMVPAVAGATMVELFTEISAKVHEPMVPLPALAIGFAVAAIVGFAAINTLLLAVRRGAFHSYAWYCLALGFFTLGLDAWQRWGGGIMSP